jgi:hypothetical protein
MTDLAKTDGNAPRFGSDLVAYALREQGFPYISLNPGASFRALHDSMVNYFGNEAPEIITCMHEEHAIGGLPRSQIPPCPSLCTAMSA